MKPENTRDYCIHNLTFIRNNSYAQKIEFEAGQNYFFMTDYYNLLKEKHLKLAREGYTKLVDSGRGNQRAVARRTMGIYVEGGACGAQVFRTVSAGADKTKGAPFLGMIQVYITDYLWKKDGTVDVQQVDSYLDAYKREIEDCLKRFLGEKDIYQIYRTITAEDFCVMIRTSKIRKIYDVVVGLMDIKNAQNKRVFFTYTNLGIECVKSSGDADTVFVGLSDSVRDQNRDMSFVLRFRIEKEALEDVQALKSLQNQEAMVSQPLVVEVVNGMIGRYDLVARLNVDEFMEIYPFLCMNIAGYDIKMPSGVMFQTELVKLIVEKMRQGIIQTINTRVMMDIFAKEKSEKVQSVSLLDEVNKKWIYTKSEEVMKIYDQFKEKYGTSFLMEQYRYNELNDMLNSLMNAYENLAYEIDTHMNWFICRQYLKELFTNMTAYMEKVQEVEGGSVPEAIEKFLDDFQDSVSALDSYLRLLQGTNQNTIQAPKYDISAPVDGQKFLIAYSEFIDGIHESYCSDKWDVKNLKICHEKRRKETTIIYPDVTIKNLELKEVFGYDMETQETDDQRLAILICKIPMFEYFERPYDLIPLVSHEICHHMLVTDRKERNRYLIKMIFNKVAATIIKEVQIRFVKDEHIDEDDAFTCSMRKCLANVLEEDYKEQNKDWERYVFWHLKKNIEDYVWTFFESEKPKRDNEYVIRLSDGVIKEFEELIHEVYEETGFGEMFEEVRKLNFETDNEEEKYQTFLKLKNAIDKMLVQINDNTIVYGEPIKVSDLQCKNNKELDFYLLQWVKENEKNILTSEESCPEGQKRQWIKYYLDLVKRAFILYVKATTSRKNIAEDRKKEVISRFAFKAKEETAGFLKSDCYYIFDRAKVKKVAFWEINGENIPEASYLEAVACITPQKLDETMGYSVTVYRETCADTMMCRWLGLDSFGYFRMSIVLGPRMMRHSERLQSDELQKERIATVLAVLARQENPGCDQEGGEWTEVDLTALQEKLWKYITEAVQCTKSRIVEAMRDDGISKKDSEAAADQFFDVFEKNIFASEKNALQGKKILCEGSIWDRLCRDELSDFFENADHQKYFQKEVNLYRRLFEMLDNYGQLQKNNKLRIETETFDHMTLVYENMTKGEPLHDVVRRVVDFYNDPGSEKKTNAQKMIDMLRFVQDYYYCNRIKKAEERLHEYLVCEKPE